MPQAFPNESNTWISMTTSTILHLSNYHIRNYQNSQHCLPRENFSLQDADFVHKAELLLHTFVAARHYNKQTALFIIREK